MISNAELIETIRRANGEPARVVSERVAAAAQRIGVVPVGDAWHDDDADAICIEIIRVSGE